MLTLLINGGREMCHLLTIWEGGQTDILNVSTITTSGCVKFSLAGVNLLLQTYRALLYFIFWSHCHTLFV